MEANDFKIPSNNALIREGIVVPEIIQVIYKNNIDLLMIGTTQNIQNNKPINGSTAHQLLLNTPCPAMIIPESRESFDISRILYIDEDDNSHQKGVNSFVDEFAGFYNAEVITLTTISGDDSADTSHKPVTQRRFLESIESSLRSEKIDMLAMSHFDTSLFNSISASLLEEKIMLQVKTPIMNYTEDQNNDLFLG